MSDLAQLLRDEDDTDNKIECKECGFLCEPDAKKCPQCRSIPILPTLREWGKRFPLGIIEEVKGGEKRLNKSFDTIDRIDWDVERAISDAWHGLIRANKDTSPFEYIIVVLTQTVTSIAGSDFAKIPFKRQMHILREMFGGDIFYLYAWVRIATIGEKITFEGLDCPFCGKTLPPITADLNTLGVATRDSVEDLYRDVELYNGFTMLGAVRKKLKIVAPPFTSIANFIANDSLAFAERLKRAVVSIDGVPDGVVIGDPEVRQLLKPDMDLLAKEIDLVSGGPNWAIEIKCPYEACGREFDYVISTLYADFFARSYQCKRRRKPLKI